MNNKNIKNISIVIPTIRENNINQFLSEWKNEFKNINIIIVEDNPTKTFNLPSWIEHYSWVDIDRELGKDSWIIPRRSDSVRSFGFIKAWKKKTKYVMTLDDDCLPEARFKNGGFLTEIISRLETKWENDNWWNTLRSNKIYPRGYPYNIRKDKINTVLHHGMWSDIPDLDGKTQKRMPDFRTKPFLEVERVPYGKFYPMCGMNISFHRDFIPTLYFLLMGQNKKGAHWGFDRFGDIWSGLFSKRIADHLGLAVSSGSPSVHHSRASKVQINIQKEAPGLPINEWLWKEIRDAKLQSDTVLGSYRDIARHLSKKNEYFKKLAKAMLIWTSFFE
jgi:hypothetical protein